MAENFLGGVLGRFVGEEAWNRLEGHELNEYDDFKYFVAEGRTETALGLMLGRRAVPVSLCLEWLCCRNDLIERRW